ncbi:MAG: CBS domain-containing protein [Azospirillum sp.]|nr:CBS domain-containing protein [Azospirillum sp.]
MASQKKLIPDVIHDQVLTCLLPTTTVRAAVEEMARQKIGAVMVCEKTGLKGIFTERDLAFRVVAVGKNPETTLISEVMTSSPLTLKPDATVFEAMTLMERRKFRHLPVVDSDNLLVGMVSIRDLFAVVRNQLEAELKERDEFIYGTSYSPEPAEQA